MDGFDVKTSPRYQSFPLVISGPGRAMRGSSCTSISEPVACALAEALAQCRPPRDRAPPRRSQIWRQREPPPHSRRVGDRERLYPSRAAV